MSRRPPRWAEGLLARVLQHPARKEIIGDLGEEFQRNGGGWLARFRFATAAIAVASRVGIARLTEGIGGDVKLTFRHMRRDPGFAAITVTALALGIGINAMIFAVADEVLLSPLPYPHEERLAIVTNEHTGSTTGGFGVSWLNMQQVAAASRTIENHSLYMDWQDLTLAGPDGAVRVPAAFVDNAYSDLMGLTTARGRWIDQDENRVNAAAPVAVLSRGAWERIYGADPGVVGRVVRLNGRPFEVVGVLADDRGDLRYRWGEQPVSVFLPLFAAEQLTEFDLDVDRGLRALNALARLRQGTSVQQARRDLNRVSAELTRAHPADNEGWSYHLQGLDEAFFEDLHGPTRILVAGSMLVLALVAVNLITLVLIRAAGRRTEMAMRRALGARATRLTRQMVTESMVLAGLAGGAGLMLASWGVDLIAASRMLDLPSFASVRLDGWIAATALAGSAGAGLVLGISAAVGARGGSASSSTWRGTDAGAGHTARRALVAAEVALAFTLLVGAGLVLTSFWELRSTGYGFDTDDLLLARVDMRGEAYTPERLRTIADRLAAEGAALPGVREAFIWSPNRLGHGNQVEILTRQNRFAEHPEERLEASLHAVHPGTLAKLGIALLAGRDVGAADHPDAPRVALISERLAQDLWPGENPIGKRFETREDDEPLFVEVIGVTADARHRTRLIDPFGPQRDVYYAFEQAPWRTVTLALRTEADVAVAPLATAVRDLVRVIDADLPVYEIATMQQNLHREESSARLSAGLVLVYAALAVGLAALGLYGMLAHSVRARRREIGVRMALGADRRTVLAGTLRSGLAPVAVGGLIGLVTSLAAGRILVRALYGVSPHEPITWLAVPLLLALVAVTALYLPARRASCTDPVEVLRTD